jgi:hypothetical protein
VSVVFVKGFIRSHLDPNVIMFHFRHGKENEFC